VNYARRWNQISTRLLPCQKKIPKSNKTNKSFPGPDIDSNHNQVIMETNLSLKKNIKQIIYKEKIIFRYIET